MSAVEERRMIACSVCSLEYDVSARTYRDIKASRVLPRCVLHRGRRSATRTAQYRRYWLDRFSLDEILEMAVALAPFPSQRASTLTQTLTASAAPGPAELGGR